MPAETETPPSTRLYAELVDALSGIEQRASKLKLDDLTASFEALNAVLQFLLADATLVENKAVRSLFRLWFAIYELQRGAKPKLLFEPTFHPGRKKHVGAPTITSAVLLRGYVVVATLLLLESGMAREEAARWLAAELGRNGIKQPNGKPITEKVILRWRHELGGKAPKGSDQMFAMIVQGIQQEAQDELIRGAPSGNAPFDPPQAHSLSRVLIKRLRLTGF
jgi:hypothetical protein